MSDSTPKWIIGSLIAIVAAGGGAIAWVKYFSPIRTAHSFERKHFEGPFSIAINPTKIAELTFVATATVRVHNPHYGESGWKLGSGVKLIGKINGEECDSGTEHKKEVITDGSRRLVVQVSCSKSLPAGGHHFSIDATTIGNCKPLAHIPNTCNTHILQGSYTLTEG